MLFITSFLLLVAGCQSALAGNSPACSKLPYKLVTPYSKVAAVTAFCASKFPVSTIVTTTTGTTTSTSTLLSTVTVTAFTTVTETDTATATTTATVTDGAAVKRSAAISCRNKSPAVPTVACPKELAAVSVLGEAVLASACSCILSTPTSTVHVTSTVVATANSLITATAISTGTSVTTITTTVTATATVAAALLPAPSCLNPAALGCSAGSACNTAGVSAECYCEQTTEGVNVCINEDSGCPTAECTSTSECQPGYSCVTSTCCGTGVCFLSSPSLGNVCKTTVAKRMVIRGGKRIPALFVEREEGFKKVHTDS